MKDWSYVAIDLICKIVARMLPNLAYVRHEHKPGVTRKADEWRTLLDYGGSDSIEKAVYGNTYNEISTIPGCLGEVTWHSFPMHYRRKALSVVKPHEELEPLEVDHPLRRLVENPNPFDTSFDYLYERQMFLELCGVCYTWLVPNRKGRPCEMYVIPSHWVWPRTGGAMYNTPDNPNADRLIQYYEVRPWGGMGSAGILKIPPEEILAERWKSPINKIDGYSRLAALAQWIDTEESISKSRWAQMINMAVPSMWVKTAADYEDPDDAKIKRIESQIQAKYSGEYNFGRPIITPAGVEITPLSFSPAEMAYAASEEQIRDMILSGFGVPKAAVGIANDMTFGALLGTISQLCAWCINPRLSMTGQTFTKFLCPRFEREYRGEKERIRWWWDDTTPHDPQQINSDLQSDGQFYAVTPNEVRAIRGRKPYKKGGNNPLVQGPGGIMPLAINEDEDEGDLKDMASVMAALQPQQPGGESGGPPGGGMPGMPGMPGAEGGAPGGQEGEEKPQEPGEEGAPPDQLGGPPEEPNNGGDLSAQGQKRLRLAYKKTDQNELERLARKFLKERRKVPA